MPRLAPRFVVFAAYPPPRAQTATPAPASGSEEFRKGNYERLFDEARRRVRAWEQANVR